MCDVSLAPGCYQCFRHLCCAPSQDIPPDQPSEGSRARGARAVSTVSCSRSAVHSAKSTIASGGWWRAMSTPSIELPASAFEQAQSEQARSEQARSEQARSEQARSERARSEQARSEQARSCDGQSDGLRAPYDGQSEGVRAPYDGCATPEGEWPVVGSFYGRRYEYQRRKWSAMECCCCVWLASAVLFTLVVLMVGPFVCGRIALQKHPLPPRSSLRGGRGATMASVAAAVSTKDGSRLMLPPARRVAIVAGSHGDELAGPWTLRQLGRDPLLAGRPSFGAAELVIGNPKAYQAASGRAAEGREWMGSTVRVWVRASGLEPSRFPQQEVVRRAKKGVVVKTRLVKRERPRLRCRLRGSSVGAPPSWATGGAPRRRALCPCCGARRRLAGPGAGGSGGRSVRGPALPWSSRRARTTRSADPQGAGVRELLDVGRCPPLEESALGVGQRGGGRPLGHAGWRPGGPAASALGGGGQPVAKEVDDLGPGSFSGPPRDAGTSIFEFPHQSAVFLAIFVQPRTSSGISEVQVLGRARARKGQMRTSDVAAPKIEVPAAPAAPAATERQMRTSSGRLLHCESTHAASAAQALDAYTRSDSGAGRARARVAPTVWKAGSRASSITVLRARVSEVGALAGQAVSCLGAHAVAS